VILVFKSLKTTKRVVYSMTIKIQAKREACKVGKSSSLQYNSLRE